MTEINERIEVATEETTETKKYDILERPGYVLGKTGTKVAVGITMNRVTSNFLATYGFRSNSRLARASMAATSFVVSGAVIDWAYNEVDKQLDQLACAIVDIKEYVNKVKEHKSEE